MLAFSPFLSTIHLLSASSFRSRWRYGSYPNELQLFLKIRKQPATSTLNCKQNLFCPQKPLYSDTHCVQDLTANYFSVVYLYTQKELHIYHALISLLAESSVHRFKNYLGFFFTLLLLVSLRSDNLLWKHLSFCW